MIKCPRVNMEKKL